MSDLTSISIGELSQVVAVIALPDHLSVSGKAEDAIRGILSDPKALDTPAGRIFKHGYGLLEEHGYLSTNPATGEISLNYSDLDQLASIEADFIEPLVNWSHHLIRVSSTGTIGFPDFKYLVRFFAGTRETSIQRVGSFITDGAHNYRLPVASYSALEEVASFNSLPPAERNKDITLRSLSRLTALASPAGIELSDYLSGERIVSPTSISIGVEKVANDRISLFPVIADVDETLLKQKFLQLDRVQDVYDLPAPDHGRVRVVVDGPMKGVFQDLHRAQHVGGKHRAAILADPTYALSDGTNPDLVNLDGYSARVIGFGEIPNRARVWLKPTKRDWFSAELGPEDAHSGLTIASTDGEIEIPFGSPEEAIAACDTIAAASDRGDATAQIAGKSVLLDEDVVRGAEELQSCLQAKGKPRRLKGYLLIHTNEEAVDYCEGDTTQGADSAFEFRPPVTLRSNYQLRSHQIAGVKWLHGLFRSWPNRTGCLLADDMGLGKTLQLATFIAGIFEEAGKEQDNLTSDPVLIVVPPILVPTWTAELDSYFEPGVFDPLLILHGNEVRRLSCIVDGIGEPGLDVAEISRHRVVITTYDTLKNYVRSLGKISWLVVITDEAQSFKELGRRSDALKALKARFRIVCTGTPVENRLLDLWNLMDFAQPGVLFGSAKEFSDRYEKEVTDLAASGSRARTDDLQKRLRYGRPDAYVLRRTKAEVLSELPPKHVHLRKCALTPIEREAYEAIILNATSGASRQHAFRQLADLSEHYRLYSDQLHADDIDAFIAESSKLKLTLSILEEIAPKKEKALIFCYRLNTQQILSRAIKQRFGFTPDTINGSVQGHTTGAGNARQRILQSFRESSGFNVLIMSQLAASVGLTIVEANHVIHYGRWWNPAKESQATDRVYRIGQKKEVHVYYPIPTDPAGKLRTFDETIEELLDDKRQLADDFFLPREAINVSLDAFNARMNFGAGSCSDGNKLTVDDIRSMSPQLFEAVVAAIFKKDGFNTLLNCYRNDRGIDVFAVSKEHLHLIQCKHSASTNVWDNTVQEELTSGHDYFKKISPHLFMNRRVVLTVVTNAKLSRQTRGSLASDIRVIEGGELAKILARSKISLQSAKLAEFDRARGLRQTEERLREMLSH